jgi:hypothetical protein
MGTLHSFGGKSKAGRLRVCVADEPRAARCCTATSTAAPQASMLARLISMTAQRSLFYRRFENRPAPVGGQHGSNILPTDVD